MKKIIFSLMIGAVVALASCSKSNEVPTKPQSGDQTATFNISSPATRAAVTDLTRYIVEAYEDNDLTAVPTRAESATGSLTIALKKNTEYTFVFWADKGTPNTAVATSGDYYDATSLLDVKVNPAAYASTVATPAYCSTKSFNSKDFEANKAVTLKNATAQLNFVEEAGLVTAGNSLTVKYSSSGKLNVATGMITEIGAEIIRTYNNIGKIAQDGIVVTDYILAPLGDKRLVDLKVTLNSESEKIITVVPFQQSYKTNVKGEYSNMYSSLFTISNQVEDYIDDEVVFPGVQIGDFYYSDNTYSDTYDNTKTCIGIVFWVDPTDGKKGKILGLDETEKKWSENNINEDTGATSNTDGAYNTAKVLNHSSYTELVYPAFAWCATKNLTAPSGINWYIPALEELQALYGDYVNGRAINDNFKTAVNASLRIVGGVELNSVAGLAFYFTSTEVVAGSVRQMYFVDGRLDSGQKRLLCYFRVISTF